MGFTEGWEGGPCTKPRASELHGEGPCCYSKWLSSVHCMPRAVTQVTSDSLLSKLSLQGSKQPQWSCSGPTRKSRRVSWRRVPRAGDGQQGWARKASLS